MVLDQSHIDPKRRACGGLRQFNFTHFDVIQDNQLLGKMRIYEDVVTAAQG